MNQLFLKAMSPNAIEPTKATTLAAGHDIYVDVVDRRIKMFDANNEEYLADTLFEEVRIKPNTRAIIPTGWAMRCGIDEVVKFFPRSGLSIAKGITMINAVALIDADFPDETALLIHNTTNKDFVVKHGERMGQLAVEKVLPTEIVVVTELPEVVSNRTGGLGSTGTK